MTEYIVKDEIVIPRRMPGSGVLGAVPETFVEITFKVRGGGLPDGEVVTVDLAELVLTGEGQLTLTHLVEDPTDLDHGIDDPAPEPQSKLSLELKPARPSERGRDIALYTVTYPGGVETG